MLWLPGRKAASAATKPEHAVASVRHVCLQDEPRTAFTSEHMQTNAETAAAADHASTVCQMHMHPALYTPILPSAMSCLAH